MSYKFRDQILKELGYTSYAQYLRSDLWKRIRSFVLSLFRGRCCCCGKRASQVHHQRYTKENLSGESYYGMVAICGFCHTKGEFKDNKKRTNQQARQSIGSRHRNFNGKHSIRKLNKRRKILLQMEEDRAFHDRNC